MAKALKLNDTQLTLLSAASQREDGLLARPEAGKAPVIGKAVQKLLEVGLVEERIVGRDDPFWREDANDGYLGLKITAAGLAAIGIEPSEETGAVGSAVFEMVASVVELEVDGKGPRTGSKRAAVLMLLKRDQGATLGDLIAATGWLPHTTRAALTGLRKQGHVLSKTQAPDGKTAYRIAGEAPGSASGAVEAVAA